MDMTLNNTDRQFNTCWNIIINHFQLKNLFSDYFSAKPKKTSFLIEFELKKVFRFNLS